MRAPLPCRPLALSLSGLLHLAACQDPATEAPDGGAPPPPRVYATACRPEGAPADPPKLALTRYFSKTQIDFPVGMITANDGSGRVFLISQLGYILVADAATPDAEARPFLDISDRIVTGGETGLLSMALDPRFAQNGWFYLNYTAMEAGELRTFVSRFRVSPPPLGAVVPGSEQVLLRLTQPFENHNGGQLAFGPDGHLYIGTGDGGAVGDPLDSGQRLETLHGKLLRIDVSAGDAGYRVPADNPFAAGQPRANGTASAEVHCRDLRGEPGPCGEIWALGFRNLWRFSFDPVGGALWGGDVGQAEWEEIDLIERGKNYGWRCLEGTKVYDDRMCEDKFKGKVLTDPVHAYPHNEAGRGSVTGGFVYRGKDLPALSGMYLFADYMDGQLYALQPAPDKEPGEPGAYLRTTLLTEVPNISSFGVDAQGEIYVTRHLSGSIERLVAADPNDPGKTGWPPRLSDTGCFADLRARRLAAGALPYKVRAPLYADGADKERALVLPEGSTLGYKESGPFLLPAGSVLIKTFTLGGGNGDGATRRPLETRLLRVGEGGVRGATYRWNDEGTDALLLSARSTEPIGQDRHWFFPGRGDCLLCHTKAAGHVLGLSAAQLDAADVAALSQAGYLTGAPSPLPPGLPAPDDPRAPLAERARAYLHANCAHCHQPGGAANTTLDLCAATPLSQTGISAHCEKQKSPSLGSVT
jgi:glucose/arabinose dehydrogenase